MDRYLVKCYIKEDDGKYNICEEAILNSMKEVREYIKTEQLCELYDSVEVERIRENNNV
ncbi:hypothetical protein [Xenorhabdus bovienii]|uniref:Uncharacterized protein n=1 Tax=Xenorhabdus bovienii str. kraussei Becker Underwood TaxID=1398204 RepID=A0A077PWS2_XENBV|nr:hypothetical protein [Xenorhabdus bovienii]CDH25151.1 hypothetical protein XBKB1_3770017 [Xenorhabdus bovienii str. kraussei Becker Underwood]